MIEWLRAQGGPERVSSLHLEQKNVLTSSLWFLEDEKILKTWGREPGELGREGQALGQGA